jgi:hypothetical protein
MNVSCRDVHDFPGLGYHVLEKLNDQGKSSLVMMAIKFSDQRSHRKLKSHGFVRGLSRRSGDIRRFRAVPEGPSHGRDSSISVSM